MTVRVAAAGDIHCSEEERARLETAFMDAERESDLILLAGDLTTYGEPEQAAVLADVARGIGVPVYAVGEPRWREPARGARVGAARWRHPRPRAGVGGGLGGRRGRGNRRDEGLHRRLHRLAAARLRGAAPPPRLRRDKRRGFRSRPRPAPGQRLRHLHVLLHYAPTKATIEGEPETIWTYLGSERLAEPIAEHGPDLVLHGHGHGGTFAATTAFRFSTSASPSSAATSGSSSSTRVGWFGARSCRVDPLAPDDLDQPAAVALAVELEEEHAARCRGRARRPESVSTRRRCRGALTCSGRGRCRAPCPPRRCSRCAGPSHRGRSSPRSGRAGGAGRRSPPGSRSRTR